MEAATRAFTVSGAQASLDDIAKEAGGGPETLYRHFPTREELLKAIYRTEVEELGAVTAKLTGIHDPVEALRAWMLLLLNHIATKKSLLPL